jgi:hypothetical protein
MSYQESNKYKKNGPVYGETSVADRPNAENKLLEYVIDNTPAKDP